MKTISPESVHLLNSVVEGAPFPIGVYVGHELKIELANQAMLAAWGKGDDVVGKLYTDILPELENQEIFAQLRGVMENGVPFHAQNKRIELLVEGVMRTHYFNYSLTPLHDKDGKIYGVMNTAAEVTDLTISRQQTKDAEEKLRLAVDSADLGIYETNLLTQEVKTSGKFNQIWGTTGDNITREEIIQRLHPDDLKVREEAHAAAIDSGNISYETRVIAVNQPLRWVKINGKVMRNEQDIAVALLGIAQDITKEKLFTEQLTELVAKQTKDLHRSNEDLLQFAHVVSHDLKEPVRKVNFFIGMLHENHGAMLDEKGKRYIEKIKHASERMALLIDGILNYSTINSSAYAIEKVDLNEIVENIKSDLELIINEKQAILIREELPFIEGVPVLIYQLFYNLISNSLKFSKAKEPPRVSISAHLFKKEDQDYIRIVVRDNGIGIEAGDVERIFHAFKRLHAKDQYEGTGLGLALCKRIVDRHGGTIEVTGEKDKGCDFIVCLPLKQEKGSM